MPRGTRTEAATVNGVAHGGTGGGTGGAPAGLRWCDADGEHIDVRGLAAPGPLVAILRLVASVPQTTPVVVHHDRDPMLLYPELAAIGWQAERIASAPGEVRLRLTRAP